MIGRKEKRKYDREEVNKVDGRDKEREKTKKRKPFKTSAVVITTGDRSTSYSEVLAWTRQLVKFNKGEMNALSTKRLLEASFLK